MLCKILMMTFSKKKYTSAALTYQLTPLCFGVNRILIDLLMWLEFDFTGQVIMNFSEEISLCQEKYLGILRKNPTKLCIAKQAD